LVDKGAVKEYKKGNTSQYEPILTREKARRSALKTLVNHAFDGAFGPLLHFLVEDEKLFTAIENVHAKDYVGRVVVCDGPLRGELEGRVVDLGLEGRVEILGHVSDIAVLREIYRRSIAAVSPGYVGLSLIQSLGNGVPMLIARDEPHAPEVEAVVDGVNGMFFESDSTDALAAALVVVADQRERWASRRQEIADRARSIYSVEHMVDAFVAALCLGDHGGSTEDDSSDESAHGA